MKIVGYLAAALFVAIVWIANWAIARYGVVDVGFGYVAPAAAYFAGIAFTLRDVVHRTLGRRAVLVAIAAGTILSLFVSTRFAVASAIAFGVSEFADLLVYEPIRRRGWVPAVAASNVVGLTVDSVLFLALAFGSLEFLPGQLIAKATMTALAIIALALVRVSLRPAEMPA